MVGNYSESNLIAANKVLFSFSISTIERRKGGFWICWELGGNKTEKRWLCRGQDFYPVWSNKWPNGGTACTALSQLIRWLRGQPALPIASWRYWTSERCKLLKPEAVDILELAGYPTLVPCVLCGRMIGWASSEDTGLDWWHLNKVSGPCCRYTKGCRQKPKKEGIMNLC